jgi:hypothetical protein
VYEDFAQSGLPDKFLVRKAHIFAYARGDTAACNHLLRQRKESQADRAVETARILHECGANEEHVAANLAAYAMPVSYAPTGARRAGPALFLGQPSAYASLAEKLLDFRYDNPGLRKPVPAGVDAIFAQSALATAVLHLESLTRRFQQAQPGKIDFSLAVPVHEYLQRELDGADYRRKFRFLGLTGLPALEERFIRAEEAVSGKILSLKDPAPAAAAVEEKAPALARQEAAPDFAAAAPPAARAPDPYYFGQPHKRHMALIAARRLKNGGA